MKKLPFFVLAIALVAFAAVGAGQETAAGQTPAPGFLDSVAWQVVKELQLLIGAVIGFLSLAGAALLNAYLNRKRDNDLRRAEAHSLAVALRAEQQEIRTHAKEVGRMLRLIQNETDWSDAAQLQHLKFSVHIYENSIAKLGLLDSNALLPLVVATYGTIAHFNVLGTADVVRTMGRVLGVDPVDLLISNCNRIAEDSDKITAHLEVLIEKFKD